MKQNNDLILEYLKTQKKAYKVYDEINTKAWDKYKAKIIIRDGKQ